MWLVVLGSVLFLSVSVAWADEDLEMHAAHQELKLARRHLQAAEKTYDGHRRAAIDHVNQALQEIRLGLAGAAAGTGKAPSKHKPETDED